MTKIDKAIEFAAIAHRGQVRKGTTIPYITHLFSVALLLQKMDCEDDIVVAGILHDIVEDTEYTLSDVEERFGKRVADIVKGCSEPSKDASWETRKKHTIEYLKNASYEIKVVVCADKLHNLRSLREKIEQHGDAFWQHFRQGYASQKWYFLSLINSLLTGLESSCKKGIFLQFEQEVKLFFSSK